MKSDEARGEFGVWLRDQRKAAGFKNAAEAVRAMKRSAGYSISVSEWAEFESGTRRPSPERRSALEGFLGVSAPSATVVQSDTAAIVAALDRQTDAMHDLVAAIREDRDRLSPEAVRVFLAQLVAEGLLARPEAMPSIGERQPQGAGQ